MTKKQGGKRKGAGRKPAPYKTKIISFRVRLEHATQLTEILKKEKKRLEN
jgi:hypothetical protein